MKADDRLRVMVVDDHAIVRAGLKLLIESYDDMRVVGEAPTGEDAIVHLEAVMDGPDPAPGPVPDRPDVVLMDLMMDGMGGIEATRRIGQVWPDLPVLILTMADDRAYLREAFAAGASGYVLKDAADVELVEAIRTVASGGTYLHPSLGEELARAQSEARRGTQTRLGVGLSEREIEVLSLVAQGYSNREVADALVISVRTVETHKTHIIQKTGLRTRAQMVRFARQAGILPSS